MKKTFKIYMMAIVILLAAGTTNVYATEEGNFYGNNTEVVAGASIVFAPKYGASPEKRHLPGSPNISAIPNLPSIVQLEGEYWNIQHTKKILLLRKSFTYAMLKKLTRHGRVKVIPDFYNSNKPKGWVPKDTDRIEIVVLTYNKEEEQFINPYEGKEFIDAGFIDSYGLNTKTRSKDVLFKAAKAALEEKCQSLLITGQGAKKLLEAFGIGIMWGGSVTHINESTNHATGSTSVGGIGAAKTKAGWGAEPHIKAQGIQFQE